MFMLMIFFIFIFFFYFFIPNFQISHIYFFLFCFYDILFSSIEPCDLDCRELFRLNAKISKVFSFLFKRLIIAWFMYLFLK